MENGLNKRNVFVDILCMLPAFVFALSILLVRMHLFSMPMSSIYWSESIDTSTLSDVFNYWKAIAIMCAAGLAVIVLAAGYFKDSIRLKKCFLYIPVLVYVALVLISLAFSKYEYFAMRGMGEHFEGTLVLLAYMIMVVFLANAIDSERRLKYVIYCVFGVTFLVGILGISQATGHDFLSTATGQKLMTPNYLLESGVKSWDMIDMLAASGQKAYDFSFVDGEVYQTVYNINYVPLYLTLLIPLSAIIFIASKVSDNKSKRVLAALFLGLYGLYLYNFFAANSASGYFGLAAIIVGTLIIFRKYLKKWLKAIICLLVVLGLVMGILADRWVPEVKQIVGKGFKTLTTQVYAEDIPNLQYDFKNPPGRIMVPIDYIETFDTYMLFGLNGDVIKASRDEEHGAFIITDGDDNQLYLRQIENEEGMFEILDDRFHDYVRMSLRKTGDSTYVVFTTVWTDWEFRYDGEKFVYLNRVGKELPLKPVNHSSLIKNYKSGSARGLIWATTLPMLKHYIVKGAGADCFTFVYPQYDYPTLYNVFDQNSLNLVTDKAHNLYLQYWVNTGLISLLAWLTLVGYYLVGAAKQFRKRGFADFSDFVNGGIFCGIIGFLFVAFFNDGSVNTMPMFYTMLGTGLAINMRDRWPTGEGNGEPDPDEGKKKEKKTKPQAGVMPEM